MEKDSKINLKSLKVDGGACANNFLMQFQSDILNVPVLRPYEKETTALGAAYLAGLAVGFWKEQGEIKRIQDIEREFRPDMEEEKRKTLYAGWKKAVERSMKWG